jgi:hypothetical protein
MRAMRLSYVIATALLAGSTAACSSASPATADMPAPVSGARAAGSGGSDSVGTGGHSGGAGGLIDGSGGAGGASNMGSAGGAAGSADAAAESGPALDAGSADPAAFIGVWEYDSGHEMLACPGMPAMQDELTAARLTFVAGTGGAPLLLDSPGCKLLFDIQGRAAVLRPAQTCASMIGKTPATFRPQTFTFVLGSADAQQMATWQVTLMPAGQPVTDCTLTASGALSRQ